jgi:hypothetical protein
MLVRFLFGLLEFLVSHLLSGGIDEFAKALQEDILSRLSLYRT